MQKLISRPICARRPLAIILVLWLALCLAGCAGLSGGSHPGEGAEGTPQDTGKGLAYYHYLQAQQMLLAEDGPGAIREYEAALKEDLFNIRNVMDQYYADNGKYPDSLNDLVDKGYMRSIPTDPFTGSNTSWRLDPYSGGEGESPESSGGYWDVHSGSDQVGLNGKKYSEW